MAVVAVASLLAAAASGRPPKPGDLVVERYPARLGGVLTLSYDRTHGKPGKLASWHKAYTITLTKISLHLDKVAGTGVRRQGKYTVTGAQVRLSGFSDLTTSKKPCRTSHLVYGVDRSRPITGTARILGTNTGADAVVGVLVPARGKVTITPCGSKKPSGQSTQTGELRIHGGGFIKLRLTGVARKRFELFVEVVSVSKGAQDIGGYKIKGSFVPLGKVVLCTYTRTGIGCPNGG